MGCKHVFTLLTPLKQELFFKIQLFMSNLYKGKSLSRSTMAAMYGVSLELFNKWLKDLKNLKLGNRRVIRPKEIGKIIKEWGEPDFTVNDPVKKKKDSK